MSNTLNAYPTDLTTPCQILLTKFSATPAPAAEMVHAAYQVVGVGLANTMPDGLKDIWDRPDGMKAVACPCDADCKACLEEGCKMRGPIGDWFKTAAGKQLLAIALSLLPELFAAL